MSKNVYLVPHDFTAVGDAALRYALFLGKRVNTEIILLNLTTSKGESIKASMKFDDLIEKTDAPPSVSFRKVVREGNIFEDIGKIAKREEAQLIIMGTHGATGMQRVFGSNAMKVVTSADVPFLIVQKDTPLDRRLLQRLFFLQTTHIN